MESEYSYRLTQKASEDLDSILSYLVLELDNRPAAADLMDRVDRAISEARCFPQSGAAVRNEFLPEMEIQKKLVKSYLLYYHPNHEQKQIVVLRVVYGRREQGKALEKLEKIEL